MDPGFLERAGDLEALREALAAVRASGAGRLLFVGGEAGVGKTTLLQTFCGGQGARILWGACEPLLTPRPLGPLLDVGDAAGGDWPPPPARVRGRTRSRQRY